MTDISLTSALANTLVADFGEEMVEGYSRKGNRAFDMIKAASE